MPKAYTPDGKVDWDRTAELALIDLLRHRHVIPWPEAISRISNQEWGDFGKPQPLQPEEARGRLLTRPAGDQERLIREESSHARPIVTFSLVEHGLAPSALEDRRGEVRALHRSYLRWTGDSAACGHHAEHVVLVSMRAAAGDGGLIVPSQRRGKVAKVRQVRITRGPLDALAFLADLSEARRPATPVLVEVKNVMDWLYATTRSRRRPRPRSVRWPRQSGTHYVFTWTHSL